MTSWEPYPTATRPTGSPSATYEPYPTVSQTPQVDDGYQVAPYRSDPQTDTDARPSVSPGEAARLAAKNWNNYSGRASRSEFWWPMLLMVIVNVTVGNAMEASFRAVAGASGPSASAVGFAALGFALLAVWLTFLIPMISLGVRRLHDTGSRGWLALTALIPGIGYLVAAILLSRGSDPSGAQFDDSRSMPFGPEDL